RRCLPLQKMSASVLQPALRRLGVAVEERNRVALAERVELSVSVCAELSGELVNLPLIHL
ncbi:MAG: hypothetical protein ACKOEZ_05945, partial [Spartobacteria bacterium]